MSEKEQTHENEIEESGVSRRGFLGAATAVGAATVAVPMTAAMFSEQAKAKSKEKSNVESALLYVVFGPKR